MNSELSALLEATEETAAKLRAAIEGKKAAIAIARARLEAASQKLLAEQNLVALEIRRQAEIERRANHPGRNG